MTNRETVIKKLQEALDDAENNGNIYAQIRRPVVFDTLVLLKEQPEIVRCGECKYNSGRCQGLYIQFVTCYRTGIPHKENWFCADGERRDGDD